MKREFWVKNDFYCFDTDITSLWNIHKRVERIGRYLSISNTVESHILGVLKIRDLKEVFAERRVSPRLSEALDIVTKYLKDRPNPAARDIHSCQEELLEAELTKFALV